MEKKSFSIQFPFVVRQAMQVAEAVAEEVQNFRPSILSVSKPEKEDVVTARFEGGLVVKVFLYDMDRLTEGWQKPHSEDWAVYQVVVRRYEKEGDRGYAEKVEEVWDATKLADLKTKCPWWHPHVMQIDEICGRVGVFVNYPNGTGEIEVDPDYDQIGNNVLVEEVSYRVLVPEDEKRALREARKLLDKLLAERP